MTLIKIIAFSIICTFEIVNLIVVLCYANKQEKQIKELEKKLKEIEKEKE